MIRIGVSMFPISTILYIVSFAVPFIADNWWYSLVTLILASVIGGLGTVLVFMGVLKDRIQNKKEEDGDDLSQY